MQKEIDNRDGKCDVAQRLSASWRSVRVGIFSFTVFFGLAASAFAGSTSSYQVNGSAGSVQNGVDIGLLNSANGVLRGTVNNNNIILGAGSSLDPNYVFGGLNVQTSANSAVSGNKLTISGGAVVSSADAFTAARLLAALPLAKQATPRPFPTI